MQSFCIRQGQVEVGVIEHEGREYHALGASVSGRNITAYTSQNGNHISLTTWCGKEIISGRCEVVEQYWSGAMALMFRLPKGKYVVGYALGENGMLFRGELLTDTDETDAKLMARMISENFTELDAEDDDTHDRLRSTSRKSYGIVNTAT